MSDYRTSTLPPYEERISQFADERLDVFCCYCLQSRHHEDVNLDHVPSKGLLIDFANQSLAMVKVCRECNEKFSGAEKYTYAILSAFISGSPRPKDQKLPKAKRTLNGDKNLRRTISQAMSILEDGRIQWKIDRPLLHVFLEKQARGHAFLECAEVFPEPPTQIWISPKQTMGTNAVNKFLQAESDCYPEIGTRWFRRVTGDLEFSRTTKEFFDDFGFHVIEPESYRYRIVLKDGALNVQSIIWNELFVEVVWA